MIGQSLGDNQQSPHDPDDDEAEAHMPVYLTYPPVGWPDALPARRRKPANAASAAGNARRSGDPRDDGDR